jgi:hypothetical protein
MEYMLTKANNDTAGVKEAIKAVIHMNDLFTRHTQALNQTNQAITGVAVGTESPLPKKAGGQVVPLYTRYGADLSESADT